MSYGAAHRLLASNPLLMRPTLTLTDVVSLSCVGAPRNVITRGHMIECSAKQVIVALTLTNFINYVDRFFISGAPEEAVKYLCSDMSQKIRTRIIC